MRGSDKALARWAWAGGTGWAALACALASCIGGGGGGGGSVPAIVSGSTCSPALAGPSCGLDNGVSAHIQCDGTTWTTVQICPPGTACSGAGGQVGCKPIGGSDAAGSADASRGVDAAGGSDAAAKPDAVADSPGGSGDVATVEVGPPLDAKPLPDSGLPADSGAQVDAKADADTKPPVPCGGACAAGTKCNPATNKCYAPCGGPCPAGKTCDESAGPPGLCVGGAATGAWGTDGKGSGVQHITNLAIGSASTGCDLTGDGKPDNAMSALGSFIGSDLGSSVASGDLVVLFDPKAWKTNGTAFTIGLYSGSPDPADSGCDFTGPNCTFQVAESSFDTTSGCTPPACPPQVSFSNAKVTNLKLTASAPQFPLVLALGKAPLVIQVSKVSLSGSVQSATVWQTTKSGLLCGAISDSDLNAAIDAAPDEAFAQVGGKAQVKSLLPMLLKKDVALNGGAKDAYSIALTFETAGAKISGMAAP
ncbi:MAG: hypothetical protein FJ100_14225 [Deltaproteobacteria bacterium]|nr:hypothetical protein [Deltaproteobacteria bacterium]